MTFESCLNFPQILDSAAGTVADSIKVYQYRGGLRATAILRLLKSPSCRRGGHIELAGVDQISCRRQPDWLSSECLVHAQVGLHCILISHLQGYEILIG